MTQVLMGDGTRRFMGGREGPAAWVWAIPAATPAHGTHSPLAIPKPRPECRAGTGGFPACWTCMDGTGAPGGRDGSPVHERSPRGQVDRHVRPEGTAPRYGLRGREHVGRARGHRGPR